MKKYKPLIGIGAAVLAAVLILTLIFGSGSEKEKPAERSGDYDVDLSSLSSTLVYSEVYNMMATPNDYVGKTVRMTGTFAIYEGDQKNYYACIIADATACCSQGIEFVLDGEHVYPDDYPELGSEITVTGTFDTYVEDDMVYCQLVHAKIIYH